MFVLISFLVMLKYDAPSTPTLQRGSHKHTFKYQQQITNILTKIFDSTTTTFSSPASDRLPHAYFRANWLYCVEKCKKYGFYRGLIILYTLAGIHQAPLQKSEQQPEQTSELEQILVQKYGLIKEAFSLSLTMDDVEGFHLVSSLISAYASGGSLVDTNDQKVQSTMICDEDIWKHILEIRKKQHAENSQEKFEREISDVIIATTLVNILGPLKAVDVLIESCDDSTFFFFFPRSLLLTPFRQPQSTSVSV